MSVGTHGQHEPAWFATTGVRTVHEGYSTVRVETVITPDGWEVEREIVAHRDAVAMVPVTADDEVVLLRQYRQAVRSYVLEIPAGGIDDPTLEPEDVAREELREEIQYEAGRLELLTSFHNSAGWSTERTHVYLATDLEIGELPDGFEPYDEEADMEIVRLPFDVVHDMVRSGTVTDAKTIIGILLAHARRR